MERMQARSEPDRSLEASNDRRRRKWMMRLPLLLSVAVALAMTSLPAAAAPKKASIVIDARNGAVLHASNADKLRYPASLTKVMTLYMVFDAIDRGKLKMSSKLRVSRYAAARPPTKLGLKPGSTIRVKDAAMALITRSANDAATVIAENLAGSEAEFAAVMTRMARRMGMKKTTFRNASGLPDKRQVTTARDMALLGRALLHRFPIYYKMFNTKEFRFRGRTYKNHNKLLGVFDGADGIKTGYIRASGYNLMASARRGRSRVIGVVFGSRSGHERELLMASLLEKGFTSASSGRFVEHRGKSSWAVQVGAFDDPKRAKRAGRNALDVGGYAFKGASVEVLQRFGGGKSSYYVARIVGLPRQQADQGCEALRKKRHDCFVRRHSMLNRVRLPEDFDQLGGIGRPVARPGSTPRPVFVAAGAARRLPWGVQVGAFPGYNSAVRLAEKAVKVAPQTLQHGKITVVPLQRKRRKPLYRARIVGIDRLAASRACATLEARKMDCLVIRM